MRSSTGFSGAAGESTGSRVKGNPTSFYALTICPLPAFWFLLGFLTSTTAISLPSCDAFVLRPAVKDKRRHRHHLLSMTKRSSNDGDDSSDRANISDDGESSLSSNDNISSSNNKRSLYNFKFYNNNQNKTTRRTDESQHTTLPELSWRITKVRLEEANTRRILRRKPLKLPYAQSSKWIQFNYAPQTKEEFEQLVMDGTLKNVYISKRPEEYYSERGEWISWDHYLLGKCSSSNGGGDGTSVNNATEILKWQ